MFINPPTTQEKLLVRGNDFFKSKKDTRQAIFLGAVNIADANIKDIKHLIRILNNYK